MGRLIRTPSPLAAAAAVLAADVAGFVVATTTGLSGASHAIVSGTATNAPAPFVVVQMTIAGWAVAALLGALAARQVATAIRGRSLSSLAS